MRWVDALPLSCAWKQILCVGLFRLVVDVIVLGITDSATKLSSASAASIASLFGVVRGSVAATNGLASPEAQSGTGGVRVASVET